MSLVPKIPMCPEGPHFSKLAQGYWRMEEWNMSPQQRLSFIQQHLELGITTVDHAHVYGETPCEQLFGEALKLEPALRSQIEIVSKFGIQLNRSSDTNGKVSYYDCSKESIVKSVETSLSRLNTDYLDVLLIHRFDYLMDADEIAEAFYQIKKSGKVKYLGVSNFTAQQFSLLQSRLDCPLVTNQVELNPLNFEVVEDGVLDQLQQVNTHPMAWSCLAGGQIFNEQSEQANRLRNTLMALKEELNAQSIDQVIYAWVMRVPSAPVAILGSGNINRINTAVEALKLCMSREQWYRIWVASKGHPVP
ncbi:aldo/keto reductase [Aliikangiella coralliicola]|uniref:Oxidoreductase n=1 Tax=Aliikangiella coralliicola TaxID=2592383 RepID=A0A545UEW4_9GAMM|nr:aldo/keto reductase [Aliikangiella coralliicola]TQV88021.1 oxidoreductase [Aliikangiella coralliicola]